MIATMVTHMPAMPTALGTLIANERRRLNWSLRDFAPHGGPSHSTMSYIERGETAQPDAETLWRIAQAFASGEAGSEGAKGVGVWFTRLLRVSGYPLDDEADAAVARLVSVLDSDRRRQIAAMTPEQLEHLLQIYASIRDDDALLQ